MGSIKSYKDLDAWQAAMSVAEQCYLVTKSLPQSEQYGLTAQMRRAAVSVAANIAEGHQKTRAGYVNHVQIALGSLAELETQLELAVRLTLLRAEPAHAAQLAIDRAGQLLHGLLRSLRGSA
jgi:four helix bundle protein